MWNEADFRTKAAEYFGRAERDDDPLAIFLWSAFGLEFLLRAPLAKLNPVLLADPTAGDGYSVLHAAGVALARNKDPLSVSANTVISRLPAVVSDFSTEDQENARFIVNLRNRELHSADRTTAQVSVASWMPRLLRLVAQLSAYFGEEPSDYLSAGFLKQAQLLTSQEDKRIERDVQRRVQAAKHVVEVLTGAERESRKRGTILASRINAQFITVRCPACDEAGALSGESTRSGRETVSGDIISKMTHFVAIGYDCRICSLSLNGAFEVNAAGLPLSWTSEELESLQDRLVMDDYEGDYGND